MMVWCGVRTVVLLVRLVSFAYSRQFAAVDVHRVHGPGILVQIQFDCLGFNFAESLNDESSIILSAGATSASAEVISKAENSSA